MDTVASILSPLNLYYSYLYFYLKYDLHIGLHTSFLYTHGCNHILLHCHGIFGRRCFWPLHRFKPAASSRMGKHCITADPSSSKTELCRLQKDSERAAQPNFNLCAAADLPGQQRQRKGHFVGIGRWTSLPAKTGSQTRPPTTAGIFQGTAGVERVVGGGIGCVVKCHCLSQADMSLDRQA